MNLIKWFKDREDEASHVAHSVGNVASRAYDQINPLDNGRTFKQRTPTNNRSIGQQLTHNGVTNVVGGVAKPVVQFANTGNLAAQEVADTVRMLSAQATHNDQALRNANIAARQDWQRFGNKNSGLFGQGTFFKDAKEAQSGELRKVVPRIVGGTLETGATVLPVGAGALAKGSLAARAAKGAAIGAGMGAVATAGQDLLENGQISKNDLFKGAVTGAILGGATPLAGRAAKEALAGAKMAPRVAKTIAKESTPDAVIHRGLMSSARLEHPEYKALQNELEHATRAANILNQNGGSPAQIRTANRRINSIQDSMMSYRRGYKQKGAIGRNVLSEDVSPVSTDGSTVRPNDISSGEKAVSSTLSVSDGNRIPPQTKTAVAPPGGDLPPEQIAVAPEGKRRGFVSTVKNSQMVTDATKRATDSRYVGRDTKNLQANAEKFAKGNLKKNTQLIRSRLDAKDGTISDTDVANAIQIAKINDAKGNSQAASDIYERLSEHLTQQGQTIQAASLLDNRTPEGLKFQAERTLKKAGVDITKELRQKLDQAHAELRKTMPQTQERTIAAKKYAKVVADSLPKTFSDKATSFWKAGLLTGIRTQTGNALSNSTFGALHGLSNPLAAGIDAVIGIGTGKRTKTLTGKGLMSGAGEGFARGKEFLKTGVDERIAPTNKFDMRGEIQFGKSPLGKAATTYVNGVFRLMGAADRPAYYAQLRNSLFDLAKADGLTKGLHGNDYVKHVDNFVKNPPKDAFQRATDEAEKAVLGNDTFLSDIAGRVRQAADNIDNPIGRNVASGAVNVLMPFTKVPSAFISRVLDFTPVGAITEAVSQMATGKLDQRALATALSEATTGTGIIYLGAELANHGLLSGDYPDDPKEQARWKAEGVQPNAVKIGNNWLSLNYFGPVGALFSQGKRAVDTLVEGGNATDVAAGFTGGAVQDALGQSFLQGVSGALDAVQDPKRYAANFTRNQAGSIIPTLVKDVGEATDKYQRDANTAAQAIKSRIPGIRQTLPVKQDVYGNKLESKTSPLSTLTNPLRPSKTITNSVKAEVNRLHGIDPNNKDLQVTPTPVNKTLSLDGNRIKLTDQQRYQLQEGIGQATQQAWGQLIQTPEYKSLNDAEKADKLNNLRKAATELVKAQYVQANNLGKTKNLSADAQALANGNLTSFASTTPGKSDYYTSPDAEYKAALSKYQNDQQNGKINPITNIRRQKELAKLKVGSKYDKDIRDLYSLSKADIYQYVTNNKDGDKLAQQLQAYDDALYNAGLTSYRKFKTGIAPAKGRKSGGSKKGKRGGIKKGSTAGAAELMSAYQAIQGKRVPQTQQRAGGKPTPAKLKQVGLRRYTVKKPVQPRIRVS